MDHKKLTQLIGGIILLFALLGFVAPSPLFGLFELDLLHNVFHLLTGFLGIYLVQTQGEKGARLYGKVFMLIFALITVVGFIAGRILPYVMPVNLADNLLHLCLTGVFAYLVYRKK